MPEPFPTLPQISDDEWNTSLRAFETPEMRAIQKRFAPFVYLELPANDPRGYNDLLHRFLASLHLSNAREHPFYFRGLAEEGGISNVYITDGMVFDYSKAFCYDASKDDNAMGLTGITLRGHHDQRSKTYPLLRIGRAFQEWLASEKIPHRLFLMEEASRDLIEIDPVPA
jgi:hypothetical protein